MDQEPKAPRWLPWVLSLLLVSMGFALGWLGPYFVLRPIAGKPAVASPEIIITRGAEAARVVQQPTEVTVRPGDQVALQWIVANDGETTWQADHYRFEPEGDPAGKVIPVRAARAETDPSGEKVERVKGSGYVRTGQLIVAETVVTAAGTPGPMSLTWKLAGPRGQVPGGELHAVVNVAVQ